VWLCRLHDFIPVEVAACHEFGALHFSLENYTTLRFVFCDSERLVEEGFVRNYSLHLHTARGGNDYFGLCIVEARRQFVCGEAAEDH
jgi:hypothetical protein